MSAAEDLESDWLIAHRALLRSCVEGQITMLHALCELVDRETRPALEARIVSHRQLVERMLEW